MTQPAVQFDGVWKAFRRGESHNSLRDLIPFLAGRFVGRAPKDKASTDQEFFALEDVSFSCERGSALGIIGPNGAGKSTTLKLLTKILRPTRGSCAVHGRVGALIEVAAGFHPDLTGRENVYLQGAIIGMRRSEIADKFDDIVAFAGMEEFIDTPVKRYSSGMNARLGFSIAANLDPEVLIIDEVLSVGDMTFQQRCLDRMAEFKRRGVAIVFVSHNLAAVSSLCERALFLAHSVQAYGPTAEVLSKYIQGTFAQLAGARSEDAVSLSTTGLVTGREPVLNNALKPGAALTLPVDVRARAPFADLTFGFVVHRTHDNLIVYDANFSDRELGITSLRPDADVRIDFNFSAHLTRGAYYIVLHVLHNPSQTFLYRRPVAAFAIDEARTWAGVADLDVSARQVVARQLDKGDVRRFSPVAEPAHAQVAK